MNNPFWIVSAIAMFLGVSTHANGQAIFSQSPPDVNEARISDFAAAPLVSQQAQRFAVSSDTEVRALVVWGYYATGLPTDDFTIRFFQDSGGSPQGTPFAQITNGAVTRVDSGLTSSFGGQTIYRHTINLPNPVPLVAGSDFYFSIVNNTADTTRWEWQAFSNGNNLRWNRSSDASSWGLVSTNLAFELYSAPIANYLVEFQVSGMVADDPQGDPDYGVVLSLNTNLDFVTVFDDTTGAFSTQLPDGSNYAVAIDFQPINQTCAVVSGGSGTISSANPRAQVQCTPNAAPPSTTPTAVPVMPLWLLGLLAAAIAGVASIGIRRTR